MTEQYISQPSLYLFISLYRKPLNCCWWRYCFLDTRLHASFEDPFSFPDPDWTISFWLTDWSTCDNESFVVAFYRHSYQINLTKHLNTSFVSCPRLASYFHPFLSQVSLVKEDSCLSPVPTLLLPCLRHWFPSVLAYTPSKLKSC